MTMPFAGIDARRWTIAALLTLVTTAGAQATTIRVPRGRAPVIDGTLDEAEWKGAASTTGAEGTTIRFRQDGRHLFIGLSATQAGFASVCASDSDTVRVFHASAALGLVTYTRGADGWTAADKEFVYGMRATALTEEARSERARYLAAHGWLASTMNMGDGRTQEMQIALDRLGKTPRLAVARFVIAGDGGSVAAWPETMTKDDGCRAPDLVRGNVPARLRFEPDRWIALDMEP